MATPGSERTRQSAPYSEDDLLVEGRSRHRSRRLPGEIKDDCVVWEVNDDGRPKTRRVNPQRLALRLGPELVAEMEAYIVPGAKMPPFSIRKDFQVRYSVDRRHIYDYFHSRGLRVAKEDKHTNLVRGRAMKAKALAQALSIPRTPTITVDTLLTPKSTTKALAAERIGNRTNKLRNKKSGVVRRSTASVKPVKESRSRASVIPDDLSAEVISGGDLSVSGTDTDWDGASIAPQFTCDSSDESVVASTSSDFLPSPNDFLAGFFGTPDHLPQIFSEIESSSDGKLDSFIAVDQERSLTKGERSELYDLISGSISSSVSVGSGQSLDIHSSVDSTSQGGISHQANSDSHDLKTWLLDDADLQPSVVGTHFFSSLRDSLDSYTGFYDASFTPIFDSDSGMSSSRSHAAILSSQNRLPSPNVPICVSCVLQVRRPTVLLDQWDAMLLAQHVTDHAKNDAENMHPGTF